MKITQEIGDITTGKAATMNNMAIIYEKQGKLQEAIKLMEQVVEICKQIKHPNYEVSLGSVQ